MAKALARLVRARRPVVRRTARAARRPRDHRAPLPAAHQPSAPCPPQSTTPASRTSTSGHRRGLDNPLALPRRRALGPRPSQRPQLRATRRRQRAGSLARSPTAPAAMATARALPAQRRAPGTTCSKSSRTDTGSARPSSPAGFPVEKWHDVIGDPYTNAVLRRLEAEDATLAAGGCCAELPAVAITLGIGLRRRVNRSRGSERVWPRVG